MASFIVPVANYGVLPQNSSQQNKAAFQAALNDIAASSRGATLYFDPVYYAMDGELSFAAENQDGKSLALVGTPGATIIGIKSGTYGFKSLLGDGAISIDGVSWQAENISSGFVRMLLLRSAFCGGISLQRLRVLRAGVMPGFVGIDIGLARMLDLRHLYIQTGQNVPYATDGIGIQIAGEIASGTDHTIYHCVVQSTGYGFVVRPNGTSVIGPRLEGIVFDSCSAFGVMKGLDIQGSDTNYLAPIFKWTRGHINASQYAIVMKKIAQCTVDAADLYLDSSGSPASAIYCQDVETIHITNNKITQVDTFSTGVPKDISGVTCDSGTSFGVITGNTFISGGQSVFANLCSGSLSNLVDKNFIKTSAACGINDNGSNNVVGASNVILGF